MKKRSLCQYSRGIHFYSKYCISSHLLFINVPGLLVGRSLSTRPSINVPQTRTCTQHSSFCTQLRLTVMIVRLWPIYVSLETMLWQRMFSWYIHALNIRLFRCESMRSRTVILSAISPDVWCVMRGCMQVGSVVWRVTPEYIDYNTWVWQRICHDLSITKVKARSLSQAI